MNRINSVLLLALLLALRSGGGLAAPLEVFPRASPADLSRPLPMDIMKARLGTGKEFIESYSAWIQLEDGGTLLLNLPISNVPELHQCSAVVNYYPPSGVGVLAEAQYAATELTATSSAFTCGPNRLERRTDGSFSFVARLPIEGSSQQLTLDAVFVPLMPAYRRGDGKIHYGSTGKYFEMVLLAPRATVNGRLEVAGKVIPIKGEAYLDYAGQNLWAHEVANFWFCYRFYSHELYVASTTLMTSPAYESRTVHHVVAQLKEHGSLATDKQTLSLSARATDPSSGYDVPGKAVARVEENGICIEIPMALSSHLLARRDILDPLNPIVRAAIRTFIARPYSYRYRLPATAQVRLTNGTIRQVAGTLLVEMILVK